MARRSISNRFDRIARHGITLAGASLILSLFLTHDAEAQSRSAVCRALNAQLASLNSAPAIGGNSRKYRQYDNAVRQQQVQISKTKRIAKRSRCTNRGIFNSRSAQCRRIVSSLKKMQANLQDLKRTRAKFAPRQIGSSRTKKRILRQMQRNRCSSNGVVDLRSANAERPVKSKRRTLLEQIFGVKTFGDSGFREDGTNEDSIVNNFGTYRTLCVRKSDGYYFPISFSTVQDRFDVDEQQCMDMCPSSDVALYHHKMPNEDSEDMVGYRSGVPYSSEPFAFAYRKAISDENSCRFSTETRTANVDGQFTVSEQDKEVEPVVGVPIFRQDPALSPDDQENFRTGLSTAKIRSYLIDARSPEKTNTDQELAENRKVRIVGPAFFPVQ